jgi:hypothetical protein
MHRSRPAPSSSKCSNPKPSSGNNFRRRLWITLGTVALVLPVLIAFFMSFPREAESTSKKHSVWKPELSPMGKYARGDEKLPTLEELFPKGIGPRQVPGISTGFQGSDQMVHDPAISPDFQSETTIAKNGSQIVIGYNDYRGFTNYGTNYPGISLSGFSYSNDGGITWNDGGQLPLLTGVDKVWGDPDVKTWTDPGSGQNYFFYSSIYVTKDSLYSLCLHVSSDGGATWSTPREITTATSAVDFPDKLFMDVDAETGRIFVSWTNFGSSVTMRLTYSDDMGLTWNGPIVFSSSGQGSVPRADGASDYVYLTWKSGSNIVFTRSSDNGLTWSTPTNIVTGLNDPMNPYGSDRIHGFPSMDVDDATGNVYIVYAARQLAPDFSDIYFIASTDHGASWSNPRVISTSPGNDRGQFFPWITCDQAGSGISVIWYDQILGSGTSDLTDVFHTHSSDGGANWDCPTPLTDYPFHAELGNTSSQPNLGDYIQAVYDNGELYSAFARTEKTTIFEQPPDCYFDHSGSFPAAATIRYLGMNYNDIGCNTGNGYWEPGEQIELFVTIENYSACMRGISGITGTLVSLDPNVTVTAATQSFGSLGTVGSTTSNSSPFILTIDAATPCGEEVDFVLNLTSADGDAKIYFSQRVGIPVWNALLDESFDGVSSPNLPSGWTSNNTYGASNPWVTSTMYSSSGPNSAYCADIGSTSLNELVSPSLYIPWNAELVDVQFDVTHNIELDYERKAWDGALLKIRVEGKDYLAGSFSTLFEPFYPWQMNRQSSTDQRLQDLSCWASDVTPNFTHVHIQYPYLKGLNIQLVYAMSTDASVGTSSGIFVDNVRVQYISYDCTCADTPTLDSSPASVVFQAAPVNQTTCDTIRITNIGLGILQISSITGCTNSPFSIDTTMTSHTVLPGDTTLMKVCVTPTSAGQDSCTIVIASNDPAGPKTIPVKLEQVTAAAGLTPPLGTIAIAPNPFGSETSIRFSLPDRLPVTVEVWSVTGRKIRTLARDKVFGPGIQELHWFGRNDRGEAVASGVYYIRMRTPAGDRKARMVLLR